MDAEGLELEGDSAFWDKLDSLEQKLEGELKSGKMMIAASGSSAATPGMYIDEEVRDVHIKNST
jgi:hypothetical protein